MVILLDNAHLHHTKAEVEDMVDGVIMGGVEDVVEDKKGNVPVPKDQPMPHWSCWSQQGLRLNCNRHGFLP